MQKISTFLMFDGKVEEAMRFYISLFKDSRIESIARYVAENKNVEGKVVHGVFVVNGQQFMAMDNGTNEKFPFNRAASLYITCETEPEIDTLYKKLGERGSILWKLDKYPFAEKYAWLSDRFGVYWQMFLAKSK